MLNKSEFDFLGITKFHEAGYTGKNVTIASKEAILNVFNDVECRDYYISKSNSAKHGTSVMDYIRQVLPNARKIACSSNSRTINNEWVCPDFEKLLKNPPQVYTGSAFNSSDAEESHMVKYKELRDKGCFLSFGAGNEGEDGCLNIVKNDVFKAISAYRLVDGKTKREDFSSIGAEVDFASLDNLKATWDNKRHRGTSYSGPIFASMVGLVQDFFITKTGKQLEYNKLLEFIKDNCLDVEEIGKDNKSGHGLFILPDPAKIDVERYIDEELNVMRYDLLKDVPQGEFHEIIKDLIDRKIIKRVFRRGRKY